MKHFEQKPEDGRGWWSIFRKETYEYPGNERNMAEKANYKAQNPNQILKIGLIFYVAREAQLDQAPPPDFLVLLTSSPRHELNPTIRCFLTMDEG